MLVYWSCPEFINYLDGLITFHKEIVVAFKDAGVPMVAGTDAGTSGIVTGFSLHDELELLEDAGLTNEETLISATRLPAERLSIDDKVGTVEIGKYADLILLDSNPLDDIKNTRNISGVFVNGRWLDKAKIDRLLLELAQKNKAEKDKYEWKKISTKDFRGKILLIDFWASWCKPCINQFPNLEILNDEFKNKGLVVLGISLDEDIKKWKKSIEKHKLSWQNICYRKTNMSGFRQIRMY